MGQGFSVFRGNCRGEYCGAIRDIADHDVLFRTDQQLFSADQFDCFADCGLFGALRVDFDLFGRKRYRSIVQQGDMGFGVDDEP